MTQIAAVLRLLDPFLYNTNVGTAVDLAERIEALYIEPEVVVPQTPEEWAKAHLHDEGKDYPNRKINFIKDIRATWSIGLKEAKDIAEATIADASLQQLRAKLTTGAPVGSDGFRYEEEPYGWGYNGDDEPPF